MMNVILNLVGPFFIFCIFSLVGCEGERSEAILDDLFEAENARDEFKDKATKLANDLENTNVKLNNLNTDYATLGQVRENLEKDKKILRIK